jgi:hypothetical protein
MSPESLRLIQLIGSGAFLLGDLYLLVLWIYAVIRTRLIFFWILTFAGLFYLLLALGNAALIYAPEQIRNAVGPQFLTLYAVFFLFQPFNLLLAMIGHTVLVSWVVRTQRNEKAPY